MTRRLGAWSFIRATMRRPPLERAGYFGSYARGDWGVGSDLDAVAIVTHAAQPWSERALDWDLLGLPVPAQLLVCTRGEWDALQAAGGRFAQTLADGTVWVHERAQPPAAMPRR